MTLKIMMQDMLNEVAMMIHAVWSVSVTTLKGGNCPGGTTIGGELVVIFASTVFQDLGL